MIEEVTSFIKGSLDTKVLITVISDLHLVVNFDLDPLLSSLILYCVIGLIDKFIHVKVIVVEFEIHCLKLCEV